MGVWSKKAKTSLFYVILYSIIAVGCMACVVKLNSVEKDMNSKVGIAERMETLDASNEKEWELIQQGMAIIAWEESLAKDIKNAKVGSYVLMSLVIIGVVLNAVQIKKELMRVPITRLD